MVIPGMEGNDMRTIVQDIADELVASGAERGLQVAVYRRGELLADVVAGVADAAFGNRRDVLTAEIPAGGTMTARAVARVYDALLTGELVPPARLRELSAPAVRGLDEVTGVEAAWGLGYAIGLSPALSADTVFGMPGSGGTVAFADTATGVAVGIMKNRIGDFTAVDRIGAAVVSAAR